MCKFLAERIFGDFIGRNSSTFGGEVVPPAHRGVAPSRTTQSFNRGKSRTTATTAEEKARTTRPSVTASNSRIGDLDFLHERQRDPEEVFHASEWADEKSVHRPIKDGPENDGVGELSDDDSEPPDLTGDSDDETSEEERKFQEPKDLNAERAGGASANRYSRIARASTRSSRMGRACLLRDAGRSRTEDSCTTTWRQT